MLALVAWAAAVRWWASQTGLWFDEVWSYLLVRDLASPLQVLTGIHHDNNHYLNSWYLRAIGTPREFFVYRLHSLVAGLGAVGLGCWAARGGGRARVPLAALLLGNSYLLIHYSSEARGYALLVFFTFASLLVTRRFLARRSPFDAALYWLCAIGGFLSHLSFAHVYLAVLVWTALALPKREASRRRAALRLLLYQGVPLLFVLCLYWIDLRLLVVGGGPDYHLGDVVVRTLSYLVGGPASGSGAQVAAVAALLATGAALGALRREGNDEWVFYFVAAVASPALALLASEPEVLFVRYFLVSVAVLLLLLADLGARLARRGRAAAWGVACVAACIALGNGLHTAELLQRGRGSFHDALRAIAEREPAETITLGGTNERLETMMLAFYGRYLEPERRVRYLPKADWSREAPGWLLASRIDRRLEPQEELKIAGGRYRLVERFHSAPLSGADWFVYQRVGGDPAE